MSTRLVHRLGSFDLGQTKTSGFSFALWVSYAFVIPYNFGLKCCYTLIWNVKINWFYLWGKVEALFHSSLPMTASSQDTCQIHLKLSTLSPQMWWAESSCLQLYRACPGSPVVSRDRLWYWYCSVVGFVVRGLAGKTASGAKSYQNYQL